MRDVYILADVQDEIDRFLIRPISVQTQRHCLDEEKFNFFFVKIDRSRIPWSPNLMQADMAECLGNRGVPSSKHIRALKENRPLCLSALVRINYAMRLYCENPRSIFRDAVLENGLGRGLPDSCVLPSLNMLDRTRLLKKGYVLFDFCLARFGIKKKDIAEHLDSRNSANGWRLINEIDQRCFDRKVKRPGEARITDSCAEEIWDFLSSKDTDGLLAGFSVHDLFEGGPGMGSGNGTWTKSLTAIQGNII